MRMRVRNLSDALKDVHKRFLENERILAEQFYERKIAPFEFLLMLVQDQGFAWLRPFSALIAEMDALVDEEEISNEDLALIRAQVDFLLKDPSSSVMDRYHHHLGSDAAFIMLHSNLKKELSLLMEGVT